MKKSFLLLFGFAILTSCSDNNPGSNQAQNPSFVYYLDLTNQHQYKK